MSSADEQSEHAEPAALEDAAQLRQAMVEFPSPVVEITTFHETPPQSDQPLEYLQCKLP